METKAGHPRTRLPPASDQEDTARASTANKGGRPKRTAEEKANARPPMTAAQRTAKYREKNREKVNAQQEKFRKENADQVHIWKQAHEAKAREKRNEISFRFRERMRVSTETLDGFFFSNRFYQSRPTFNVIDSQGARGLEEWETPDEMVKRMRMQKMLPPIPAQAKELSPKRPKKEGPT
jgi:hypothetical protein